MKTGSIICFHAIVICCLRVGNAWANKYSEPYSCYGDVCNADSDAQFCDVANRFCRMCEDVRDDCFTRLQMFNCSQFCYEYKYKQDLDKLRVEGCLLPLPPKHGRYTVNTTRVPIGAKVTVTCEAGYTVRDEFPLQCSNFSMWAGSPQTCEGSLIDWKILAIIALGVCFLISLVINIICMATKYHRCMDSFTRKQGTTPASKEKELCILTEEEKPKVPRNRKNAPQTDIKQDTETARLLPSAPDAEHKIDIEDGDSVKCKNDTNKTPKDPDVKHPSSTNNKEDTKHNSDANAAADGMSTAKDKTSNEHKQHEGNEKELGKGSGTEHGPNTQPHLMGLFNTSSGNGITTVNVQVLVNPKDVATTEKQPDCLVKQPDTHTSPVTDQTETKSITKSMGSIIPDAPTKGPVTQPADEGFGSWEKSPS